MLVMKFGGVSLGSGAKLRAVIDQLERARASEKVVVVVSAMGRTTDWLVRDDLVPSERSERVLAEHEHALEMVSPAVASGLRRRICALPSLESELTVPELHAFGEEISSALVNTLLLDRGVRSRDTGLSCVCVDPGHPPVVDQTRTLRGLREVGLDHEDVEVLVVGGFAGHDRHGVLHLLGRGGSDTSATSIGAAIGARVIELWKDVGGIHATDPRGEQRTVAFEKLGWEDADVIARSGMRILHESSIEPAWRARIPIHVRHTGYPDDPGTWIEGGRRLPETGEQAA